MDLRRIIKEELLKEYSEKIVKQLKDKFQKEDDLLNDTVIEYYINRFEQLKNSPKITQKDITKYTFKELEEIVDKFPNPNKEKEMSGNENTADVSGEAIYNKNGIEVYLGDEQHKCVSYRKAFEKDTQGRYSWCVARSDASNLFNGYRFQKGYRVFYFIINRNLPISEPNHVCVIHVFTDGKYGYTSSKNDGDKDNLSWEQVLEIVPYLKDVPQSLFQSKELTPSEKEKEKYVKRVNDVDLVGTFGYEGTKNYIIIGVHKLNEWQFNKLVLEKQYELLNVYINIGHNITKEQLNMLTEPLQKNYARMGLQLESDKLDDLRIGVMIKFGFGVDEIKKNHPKSYFRHMLISKKVRLMNSHFDTDIHLGFAKVFQGLQYLFLDLEGNDVSKSITETHLLNLLSVVSKDEKSTFIQAYLNQKFDGKYQNYHIEWLNELYMILTTDYNLNASFLMDLDGNFIDTEEYGYKHLRELLGNDGERPISETRAITLNSRLQELKYVWIKPQGMGNPKLLAKLTDGSTEELLPNAFEW